MSEIRRVGAELSSRDRWKEVANAYIDGIDTGYHRHRMSVIRALLPDLVSRKVVEFGCGEGALLRLASQLGAAAVHGLDQDETMVQAAQAAGSPSVERGSLPALGKIASADCLIAANVLGYLRDDEERDFYAIAARLLPPGGHLVIAHSNELFDLFTFNKFTVSFFSRHFESDVASLLQHPTQPPRSGFNIRENPLVYGSKLSGLGFEVERMEFINFHEVPPLLTKINYDDLDSRSYRDTLDWPDTERWKLMFQCSMFGVRARRAG